MARLHQHRKGIVLAGGRGTRLGPLTRAVNKHLLPIHDRPMIHFPLACLMMAGLREIAVISTPEETPRMRRLLGDGRRWGLRITHLVQPQPDGIARALILAEDFLDGAAPTLALGDNVFLGRKLGPFLRTVMRGSGPCAIVAETDDPSACGVLALDGSGKPVGMVEKPATPPSNLAVTGFYRLDPDAPDLARSLVPSPRGEVEITDLLEIYLQEQRLGVVRLPRGISWFDAGTPEGLFSATCAVRELAAQGISFHGCPEEIAWRNGWIPAAALARLGRALAPSTYGRRLVTLADAALDHRSCDQPSAIPLPGTPPAPRRSPAAFRHAANVPPL